MSKKNIVVELKGAAKPVASDYIDAAEADRLLREVLPKIGTSDAISLPGLVVRADEVISAKTNHPPSIGIA